jgi:hypothetical protein
MTSYLHHPPNFGLVKRPKDGFDILQSKRDFKNAKEYLIFSSHPTISSGGIQTSAPQFSFIGRTNERCRTDNALQTWQSQVVLKLASIGQRETQCKRHSFNNDGVCSDCAKKRKK